MCPHLGVVSTRLIKTNCLGRSIQPSAVPINTEFYCDCIFLQGKGAQPIFCLSTQTNCTPCNAPLRVLRRLAAICQRHTVRGRTPQGSPSQRPGPAASSEQSRRKEGGKKRAERRHDVKRAGGRSYKEQKYSSKSSNSENVRGIFISVFTFSSAVN